MGAVSLWGRRATVALVLAALLTGFGAADVFAARRPLTIRAEIGREVVWGQVTDNAYVEVVVRDAVGSLLDRGLAHTYAGEWVFYATILPGFRIKATAFNVNGVLETRRLTVPNLTIAVDRATDTVSGKAPRDSRLIIGVQDRFGLYNIEQPVKADSTGAYAYDFGADGVNIQGGTSASVTWSNATGTTTVQGPTAVAPYLWVEIGQAWFGGSARRNRHVEVTLTDGAANVVGVGHAVGSGWGDYSGVFADASEDDYLLQAGDWLTAPAIGPDVDWRVPAGIEKINPRTDVVSGECFPGGAFELYAFDPAMGEANEYGSADASGHFSVDLTPSMNVTRNSSVLATCWTSEGDAVWDGRRWPYS